jgi:hypothetical protein
MLPSSKVTEALKTLIHGEKNIISFLLERCNSENTVINVSEATLKAKNSFIRKSNTNI